MSALPARILMTAGLISAVALFLGCSDDMGTETTNGTPDPHAPALAAIGPRNTAEGNALTFAVSASDPDGTTPALLAGNLPSGAAFTDNDDGTGAFNWTPATGQAGSYHVTFTASDGVLTDHEVVAITVTVEGNPAAILADHTTTDNFTQIPSAILDLVRDSLVIYYGHTSHGSQLLTGINQLATLNASYAGPPISEYGDDLGSNGDTSWAAEIRLHLNGHPETNVVIWSWCGGVSTNTEEGINAYLTAFSNLESAYPDVAFVYMTGHLDGTGPSGNLYTRNNQIRAYCAANGKILFDFADIESYDPEGNYYPDETDACTWCATWCAAHACEACSSCAHSHCFNCYRKGQAFWWLMARLVGWSE